MDITNDEKVLFNLSAKICITIQVTLKNITIIDTNIWGTFIVCFGRISEQEIYQGLPAGQWVSLVEIFFDDNHL